MKIKRLFFQNIKYFSSSIPSIPPSSIPPPPPPSSSSNIKTTFWTLPNKITISRIFLSPIVGYAIYLNMKDTALIGCLLGSFTDWLDGYIAKNYNQKSIWGGILDPVADKVFVGSIAAGLTLKGLFPMELFMITIGRDVILIGSGLIIRAIEKDKDSPFFDAQSATFEIVPTNLSKVILYSLIFLFFNLIIEFIKANTALQFILLATTLSHFYTSGTTPPIEFIQPLWYLTGLTTIASGLQYVTGVGLKKVYTPKKMKRFTWD